MLLTRLENSFGVTGVAREWIASYLTDRTQFVRVGSEACAATSCSCGVPQGSVLGPLLFVAYICPVVSITTQFGVSLNQYACALVNSRLDYANTVLYDTSAANIAKLQRVQNALARVVTLKKRTVHIRPVLEDLHWLPIKYRIDYKVASRVHKVRSTGSPAYLQALVSEYTSARQLRSSKQLFLRQTRLQPSCSNYLERPTARFTLRCYIRTICDKETFLRTGFHELIT